MLTRNGDRSKFIIFLLILFAILLVACQSTAQPTSRAATATASPTGSRPTTQIPHATPKPTVTLVPTDTPDEVDQQCCADYRIGLLGAPTTLNYWRYLGEDNSLWTGFVIADEAPTLYTFPDLRSDQRLDFVPALAADLPPQAEQHDDFWVVPVKMIETATWSDGEPITAHDIVFTIETVFDLQLGGGWQDFYPAEILAGVEATDDHTVEFAFYDEPVLSDWQFAVAMGPILPQHYWAETVAEARALIEGVDPPAACGSELDLAQVSACQAYASARQILYEVEPAAAPSGGGYITTGLISKDTVRRKANPYYFAAGVKIMEYSDGTWMRTFPDGTSQYLFGEADGELLLSYHEGPFSNAIQFTIYNSRLVAYDALTKGRVDYVLNPDNQTADWQSQTVKSTEIKQYLSSQNGLAYLAFNLHRSPFDDVIFRQAIAILIDQEKIAEKDLEGRVFPAFSIIPAANAYWWNPALSAADEVFSAKMRFELAVQTFEEAGWSWRTAPTWNASSRQINPGDEIRLSDGSPLPEISLIYPDPSIDSLLSAYGDEIAHLLTSMGIPVRAEPLDRDAIINRTLIAGGSFDLYLLDWRFPLYPDYLCDLFQSENDTLLTGNYNTTGYNNPEFDALCDLFLAETDPQRAQEQVFKLQTLLADDLPYIPLYNPQILDLIHENVVLPYIPDFDGIVGNGGFQMNARILIK